MIHLVEGLIRLALLVGYVWAIGQMQDVKRVFGYHGAEHMTIHAFEHNDPLDPEHIGTYPPAHPRCGTAFLLQVVAISVVLFALVGRPTLWLRVAVADPLHPGDRRHRLRAAAAGRQLPRAAR